jgi:uncharacterized RDD family membrane protein YckC
VTKYAAFWKRLLAYLIDMTLISFIVLTPFLKDSNPNLDFSSIFTISAQSLSTDVILTAAIVTIISLIYWTYLEYTFGQSIGKIIFGLEIKNTTNKKLKISQVLLRNVTKLSTLLISIDTLYMLFSRKHQRYTEKLSRTFVTEGKQR